MGDELINVVDIEPVIGRPVQAAEPQGQPVGNGLPLAQVHPRGQRNARGGHAKAHARHTPVDMNGVGHAVAADELSERDVPYRADNVRQFRQHTSQRPATSYGRTTAAIVKSVSSSFRDSLSEQCTTFVNDRFPSPAWNQIPYRAHRWYICRSYHYHSSNLYKN